MTSRRRPSSGCWPTTGRATGTTAPSQRFIKSIRGNDPDAALYWLATMVAAGEDPKFIARRLIISASEDVGQRRPAGAADRRGRRAGPRLGRAAGGAVRPRAGHRLHGHGAQVEPLRAGVLGGHGRRAPARLAAGPEASPERSASGHAQPRHRCRLQAARTTTKTATWSSSTCLTTSPTGRYYEPTEQGWEARIRERMDALVEARKQGSRKRR